MVEYGLLLLATGFWTEFACMAAAAADKGGLTVGDAAICVGVAVLAALAVAGVIMSGGTLGVAGLAGGGGVIGGFLQGLGMNTDIKH
jgi:hypothetical protein